MFCYIRLGSKRTTSIMFWKPNKQLTFKSKLFSPSSPLIQYNGANDVSNQVWKSSPICHWKFQPEKNKKWNDTCVVLKNDQIERLKGEAPNEVKAQELKANFPCRIYIHTWSYFLHKVRGLAQPGRFSHKRRIESEIYRQFLKNVLFENKETTRFSSPFLAWERLKNRF